MAVLPTQTAVLGPFTDPAKQDPEVPAADVEQNPQWSWATQSEHLQCRTRTRPVIVGHERQGTPSFKAAWRVAHAPTAPSESAYFVIVLQAWYERPPGAH
jgi:hypothetical protein